MQHAALLERLKGEHLPGTGQLEAGSITVTWTPEGVEIADGAQRDHFSEGELVVQLSRSERSRPPNWLLRLVGVRTPRLSHGLHLELRGATMRVRLSASVDDPEFLEGLPYLDIEGEPLKLPVALTLLEAMLGLGARVALVQAHAPNTLDPAQAFTLVHQLSQAQERIASLEGELASLQARQRDQQAEAQLGAAQRQAREAQSRVEQLEQRLHSLSEHQQRNTELEEQLVATTAQRDTLQRKREQASIEVRALRRQIELKDARIQDLQHHLANKFAQPVQRVNFPDPPPPPPPQPNPGLDAFEPHRLRRWVRRWKGTSEQLLEGFESTWLRHVRKTYSPKEKTTAIALLRENIPMSLDARLDAIARRIGA